MKRLIERIEADFEGGPACSISSTSTRVRAAAGGAWRFELLWTGTVAMSEEDTAVDWWRRRRIFASVYRWIGVEAV